MKTKYKLVLLVSVIVFALLERYLFFNQLNFATLSLQGLRDEGLTPEQITGVQKIQQWGVLLGFTITLFSVLIISSLIYLGCLLFSYEKSYKKIFFVVFISESVIILGKFINFFYLKSHLEDFQAIEHLKKFQVLSLQFLSPYSTATEAFYTALGSINIFQVIYWFLICYGLKPIINKPFWKTFEVVLYSYVSVYVFFVLGKLLFTINLN